MVDASCFSKAYLGIFLALLLGSLEIPFQSTAVDWPSWGEGGVAGASTTYLVAYGYDFEWIRYRKLHMPFQMLREVAT